MENRWTGWRYPERAKRPDLFSTIWRQKTNSSYPNRVEKRSGFWGQSGTVVGQVTSNMKIRRFQVKVRLLNSETPVLSSLTKCWCLIRSLLERKVKGSFLGKLTSPIKNASCEKITLLHAILWESPPPVTPFHAPGTSSQPWMFYSWMTRCCWKAF